MTVRAETREKFICRAHSCNNAKLRLGALCSHTTFGMTLRNVSSKMLLQIRSQTKAFTNQEKAFYQKPKAILPPRQTERNALRVVKHIAGI